LNLALTTRSFTALRYLDGIDTAKIEEAIANCSAKDERRRIRSINTSIRNRLSLIESVETYSVVGLNDALAELAYIKTKLTGLTVHDPEDFKMVGELLVKCVHLYDNLSKKITVAISADKAATLDLLFNQQ